MQQDHESDRRRLDRLQQGLDEPGPAHPLERPGPEGLEYQHSYLVTSNHQSWVDILVLQYQLNRRIPLLRFFLKQELIWVPIIGLCWWALDFPS